MPERDLIVVGASAGGVEALVGLVKGLPPDLPATVLVVLHVSPAGNSLLPQILDRAGPLRARHAIDGEMYQQRHVYVAPPDLHLLVSGECLKLVRGPRENGHRPAVDPLFRSAGIVGGPRVIGVVLSGNLDDGTAGLVAIKQMGGVTMAQDPAESAFPGMPQSAIRHADVDHVGRVEELVGHLTRMAGEPVPDVPTEVPESLCTELEAIAMEIGDISEAPDTREPSQFTCPECGGTLFEMRDANLPRYRCRVGHAYSLESLASAQDESLEAALWSAAVALREKASLSRRLGKFMRDRGYNVSAERYNVQARDSAQRAGQIQKLLEGIRASHETAATGNGQGGDGAE